MKDKALLILAAGMGSRFGGLKQMTPFGPNGEFIIDYSVYDAIRCGFNKIVFVIKEENYRAFRTTIGKRIQEKLSSMNIIVSYAFQNIRTAEEMSRIPAQRVKPLGTGHAVLCAKEVLDCPFLMINADDFYGYEAFKEAAKYLDNNSDKSIGIVGYNVKNTLTENGSVKRGVIFQERSHITKIVESNIEIINGEIIAKPLSSNETYKLEETNKVSMNMIAFYPNIFNTIEARYKEFLAKADVLNDEFLIPDIISFKIEQENAKVKLINTDASWCGVTYKEDTPKVVEFINEQINKGIYPNNLWN